MPIVFDLYPLLHKGKGFCLFCSLINLVVWKSAWHMGVGDPINICEMNDEKSSGMC